MAGDRVHVRHAGVQGLADAQGNHHTRFEGILGDIKSVVNQTLAQWYGDGTEEYRAKQRLFDSEYEELQLAFASLRKSTEASHANFTRASTRMRGIWS